MSVDAEYNFAQTGSSVALLGSTATGASWFRLYGYYQVIFTVASSSSAAGVQCVFFLSYGVFIATRARVAVVLPQAK